MEIVDKWKQHFDKAIKSKQPQKIYDPIEGLDVVIHNNGTVVYYIKNTYIYHRLNNPAVFFKDENTYYYQYFNYGKLHRLDGYAKEYFSFNIKEYWIEGIKYGEDQYWKHPLVYMKKHNLDILI
jgi:hypothetical protein